LLLRYTRMATERSVNRRSGGRSHVHSLQIHWGLISGHITALPSILSVRKAAPVVDAEMYGAESTGENAD
jgi:hypothetical protein